jgi:phosphoglycerate dehydrogenase-like enzyme
VVGVLPGTEETYEYFNMERVFSKMKKSGIFMNIGRGTCAHEEDLVQALKTNVIAGAVLDVFKVEPLPETSELWGLPNVLLFPHSADLDHGYYIRAWDFFDKNMHNIIEGKPLINVCDKQLGY